MQIGYSSCGILQFVSRIDSIKIPAVYDCCPTKEESRSKVETCRGIGYVSAHGDFSQGGDTTRYHEGSRRATCSYVSGLLERPFKGSSGLFVCRISNVFERYRHTGSMAFNETMMETRERERERKRERPSLSTLMRLVFLRVAREQRELGTWVDCRWRRVVESWRVSVGADDCEVDKWFGWWRQRFGMEVGWKIKASYGIITGSVEWNLGKLLTTIFQI